MPRNPQIVARQKLEQAVILDKRSDAARKKSRQQLNDSMVKAVEAGLTRGEVARIVGVSLVRVTQIPGMPSGKNVHKAK